MPRPAIRPPASALRRRAAAAAALGVPPVPAAPRYPHLERFREQLLLRLQECFPEYEFATCGTSPALGLVFVLVNVGEPANLRYEVKYAAGLALAQNVVEAANGIGLGLADAMRRKRAAKRLDNLAREHRALQYEFPQVLIRLKAPPYGLNVDYKVPGGEWRSAGGKEGGGVFNLEAVYTAIAVALAGGGKRARRDEEEEEE